MIALAFARTRNPVQQARKISAVILVSTLVLAACSGSDGQGQGGTGNKAGTAELRTVIDAARKEGQLRLSWAPAILGAPDGVSRLIAGYKKFYGLDIDVRFTPGSGQGEIAAKIEQEIKAKLPASTDILSMNASGALQISKRGVLLKVDWPGFSSNVTAKMVSLEGAAVGVQSWLLGIAYDTSRVTGSNIPKTMQDLLKPQYKKKVFTTPFGGGFDLLASSEGWGRERTIDYVKKFSCQIGGLNYTVTPLLNGEFDIMALLVPPGSALKAKSKGAPVEFIIPTDAALLYEHLVGIPSNSAHPNAAKLFIDYLMGPAGQTVLREVDFADSPLVEDSYTGKQIRAAEASGAKFIKGDVSFYERYDPNEYQRDTKEILGILFAC